MTALIERRRRGQVLCVAISAAVFGLFAPDAAKADGGNGAGDDGVSVQIDHARLIKLPERAATVVVGNPLIADITIQPGGVGVLNARGYGVTNLIVLDRTGAVLTEKQVIVKGPYANTVVVYRGMNRNTYSCSPFCEPRITLGDAPSFFGDTLGQTGTWLGQVQGAAQMGATSENPRDRADRDRDRDRRTFDRRDSGGGMGWPFF
jgi:hypothetical protein